MLIIAIHAIKILFLGNKPNAKSMVKRLTKHIEKAKNGQLSWEDVLHLFVYFWIGIFIFDILYLAYNIIHIQWIQNLIFGLLVVILIFIILLLLFNITLIFIVFYISKNNSK